MLVAKFVPGFASVSTAMAGAVRMRYWRFLAFDAIGALLWVGVAVSLGYLFREAVSDIIATLDALGRWGVILVLVALALYVAARWWQRHLFIKQLRMDRISVDELQSLIDDNRVAAILDVRSRMAQDATGHIPGASRVDVQSLEGLPDLVEEGEIVVYCACPNEESAVAVARRLRAMGFRRVRPLHGGIDAWISAGRAVDHANALSASA
jgi:rhodanese-related sulfurtransferase